MAHVPGVARFVGEHEKEVVKETEGPRRRGSVYMRMDSNPDEPGQVGEVGEDEVSLGEDDLEEMGGDEVRSCFLVLARN